MVTLCQVLTISTVNVNGLRAAAKKGLVQWLDTTDADIVCLQETRAEPGQVPTELTEPNGWHMALAESETKGRAGVALLSRTAPEAVRIGFGSKEFDRSGRYLECEFPGLVVASLYLPSGETDTPRQDEKYRFLEEFLDHLIRLRESAGGRDVVVCGDWNIAHREVDLKNWKSNQRSAGFLPQERSWLDRVYGEAGYVDVVRGLHPDGPGPYSWWSYRGKAFDNDSGWRIDLVVTTEDIARRAKVARVERAATYQERWSDHAPVTVTFDWPS